MKNQIKSHIAAAVITTSGAGVALGFTGGDVAVVAGSWGAMMVGIACEHGVKLDLSTAVKASGSILAMIAAYRAGSIALTWAFNALLATVTFGASIVVTCGINGVINGLATYRLGKLFDKMYGEDGVETAIVSIGTSVIKSLFRLPSISELSEFFDLWD